MFTKFYKKLRTSLIKYHKSKYIQNKKYPTTDYSDKKKGVLICGHCAEVLDPPQKKLDIDIDYMQYEIPIYSDILIKNTKEKICLLPQTVVTRDFIKQEMKNSTLKVPYICPNCNRLFQSFIAIKALDIYTVLFY
jgi:hypothetical protein